MWQRVVRLWQSASLRTRGQTSRRRGPRLGLEQLENRLVPSSFTAGTVTGLIKDISTSNKHGGDNTITLTAGDTFTLTKVNNKTDGSTGLPIIKANDNLTIIGNGDTIQRSTAVSVDFRLFDVAHGASLSLQNMFLENGEAYGSGVAAEGGAIYNQGTLDLNFVTVEDNSALGKAGSVGHPGQSAFGGGIYSKGALTMENGSVIEDNTVTGGSSPVVKNGVSGGEADGGGLYVAGGTVSLDDIQVTGNLATGGIGSSNNKKISAGRASGGGVYVAGGTVTLDGDTLSTNSALGGNADFKAAGGMGFGGGLAAAGGTVTLRNDSVTENDAQGGSENYPTAGNALSGGSGIAINAFTKTHATVFLDTFTQANTVNNNNSNGNTDTYGPYTLIT